MAAAYPGTIRVFTTKRNILDIVDASHPNTGQEEIVALQTYLGLNPHLSTNGTGSSLGAWSSASRTYLTVSDRIANSEAGHLADTHTQYLHLAGGDVMIGSAAAVIVQRIRARADQTAALLRVESTDQATAWLQVGVGTVTLNGTGTLNGSPILTQATAPQTVLSDALPNNGPRAAGTGTAASRGDHSHGPTSSKGFTLSMMGA